jgi:hypothetical protein
MKTALNPTVSMILAAKKSYAGGTIMTPGSFSSLRSIVVFFISTPFCIFVDYTPCFFYFATFITFTLSWLLPLFQWRRLSLIFRYILEKVLENTVNFKASPLGELIDVIGKEINLQFTSVLRLLFYAHMLNGRQANGKGVPYLSCPFTVYVIALHHY